MEKLMMRQTRTGWYPVKGTIVMDEEWWKKARADIPGCGKFKKLGLQNEEDMQKCFGDIISIGNDHWLPHMVNVAPTASPTAAPNVDGNDTQDVDIDLTQDVSPLEGGDTNEVEQISPVNANGKRPPRPAPPKGKNLSPELL
ncbi:hypothetical protein PR202_gb27505 [Eleusine coracana subsp. coracana]|uniref:Uncharacterized protein n=1 Tax=Eleusine coracana subsp. coracana TaxID=191504 RepID=A0AAV5FUQ5_ELECO|nr:hypothetical protein PR202_gb27505 [Eleusine coracana subsp. coracana]